MEREKWFMVCNSYPCISSITVSVVLEEALSWRSMTRYLMRGQIPLDDNEFFWLSFCLSSLSFPSFITGIFLCLVMMIETWSARMKSFSSVCLIWQESHSSFVYPNPSDFCPNQREVDTQTDSAEQSFTLLCLCRPQNVSCKEILSRLDSRLSVFSSACLFLCLSSPLISTSAWAVYFGDTRVWRGRNYKLSPPLSSIIKNF